MTLSVAVGTPAGFQFPAVPQSLETAPVHVLGGAALPVAPKVTDNAPAVAEKLCAAVDGPRVTPVEARPSESVTTWALSTAPPESAANVTVTPGTPRLSEPFTCTTSGSGSGWLATPVWPSPETFTMAAGFGTIRTVVESLRPGGVGDMARTVTVPRVMDATRRPAGSTVTPPEFVPQPT